MVRAWIVGVVIVVGCGGGSKAGSGSPEELAKAAIERAGSGDVDRMMALTGMPGLFDQAMDCVGDQADAMRTKMVAQTRDSITRDLPAWKGVTATIDGVQPEHDPIVIKAGKTFGACATKTDLTTQRFKVTVKTKGPDGKEQIGVVDLTAMQVGGRWYLEDLSAPGADDHRKMKAMKDAMCACKDAACVDKVQKDYADFMKAMEEKYKGDQKPDEEMMKTAEEMAECMTKAMSGGAP